ncbi:hypothetical protein SAMN05880582_1011094 [Rhizobium sp. RU20A]|uniref:hypothetical protein n=1 Tax=Rhizobium sp. RU20A TaxID=1907412 RepID=UPI00095712E0|nr:hypothetical protein [Rhizobium sp. RU20A]SIQ20291.1 hypothetical protein SAMN05880582_1011094 [Rhizobium sp. RU20A]
MMTRLRTTLEPQTLRHTALAALLLALTVLLSWGWSAWLAHGSDLLLSLDGASLAWCL